MYAAITAFPTTPHGTLYPFIVMFVLIFPAAALVKYFTKAPFFTQPPLTACCSSEAEQPEPELVQAGAEARFDEAGAAGDMPDA